MKLPATLVAVSVLVLGVAGAALGDGASLIADDSAGTVWRISYER